MEINEKQTNKAYPVIRIDRTSDIHYEAAEEFKMSVLSTAFKKAFRITEEIVKSAENALNGSSSTPDKGTKIRNDEQFCNIIFFTGERGTGKTSAMLSYMEFLKDYYRNANSDEADKVLGDLKFDGGQYMFTGLEYIDASSLDRKEDILANVLSKMLKKWKEEEGNGRGHSGIVKEDDYDYKRQKIRGQFSEIYQRVKDLRSDKDLMQMDSDMYLDTLERMSLTRNVRNSFKKLVNAYLDIMIYPGSRGAINNKNHFLVISIDDMDMNIQHGFMLLEQIRKYLMVPNVIVLLSANYEQLEKICINYYSKKFKSIKDYKGTKAYVRRLSREYLEKMMPISNQVQLMSGRSWRFFNQDELIIQCGKTVLDERGRKKRVIEEYEHGTLTKIVRKVMKDYFYMEFALDDKCIGFLTPQTLRELCTLFTQIKDLNRLTVKGEIDSIGGYENNIKWFVDIEFPRLCNNFLSGSSDRSRIDRLGSLEISEQMELIQERGINESMSIKRQSDLLSLWSGKKEDNESFSTLKVLADADKGNGKSQEFARICLIYLSIKLAESAFKHIYAKNEQERKRALDDLLRYYSINEWGIWGKWEDKFIPKILVKKDPIAFIDIARTHFKRDNNCLLLDFQNPCKSRELKKIKEFIGEHTKLLKNYQYLLLFYNLDIEDSKTCIWNKMDGTQIKLSGHYSGVFSLSGFVLNLLEGAKLVKAFSENLPNLLFPNIEKSMRDKVKAECDSVSIWTKDFQEATENPLLPLQNVEFLIDMGRKIQNWFNNKNSMESSFEGTGNSIKKYFAIMQECLDEYDEIYKTGISDRFRKFPLVSEIASNDSTFIEFLVERIRCHTDPEIYDGSIDWSGEGENG